MAMTNSRMPVPRSCCIDLVAPGGGVVEAIGAGTTVYFGSWVDAVVGSVFAGLIDAPCPFGKLATRREVASAERAAVSCGEGSSGLFAKAPMGSMTSASIAGLITAGLTT